MGVIYNLKNPYLGLGNGRQYWGGEAVLGGAVWGGGGGGDCSGGSLREQMLLSDTITCVLY